MVDERFQSSGWCYFFERAREFCRAWQAAEDLSLEDIHRVAGRIIGAPLDELGGIMKLCGEQH